MKDHLDDGDEEDGSKGDCAWHGIVVLGPEVSQARIAQGDEGGREKVYKGGGDQNAGSEVAHREEETVGNA